MRRLIIVRTIQMLENHCHWFNFVQFALKIYERISIISNENRHESWTLFIYTMAQSIDNQRECSVNYIFSLWLF